MIIPPTLLHQRADTAPQDDKSNIVTIVAWATLVTSILVFVARQCIKLAVGRKNVGIDDFFILTATVFAVGLSVSALILAQHGLGVLEILTLRKADAIQKVYYASELLYVTTIGFSKLSLISFFYAVHHQRGQRRAVLAIGIFIFAWTIASLAAVAFQCGLPKPWEVFTLHCYNIGVLWIVYCIIDMTSDVAIIMLSINLVAYLKVKLSRKIAVVACFAPRLLVIGAALVRLVYLFPISPHNNPAFHLWIPLVITQIQACLSIVTACIPYVRAFFDKTESSLRRRSRAMSKIFPADEESYGYYGYSRGYKKGHGQSTDSNALGPLTRGKASDTSPRIRTPTPVSPLMAQFVVPANTPFNGSRPTSEAGLRLIIPEQTEMGHRNGFTSPQTASSNALSPADQSPHPLLSAIALAPIRSTLVPAADEARSKSAVVSDENAQSPSRPQRPQRLSLFPSPQQQRRTRPPVLLPSPTVSRLRTDVASPLRSTQASQIPETQEPPLNDALSEPTNPRVMFIPRPSSSLERVAYDDPLRSLPMAVTTSAAVLAPIQAPVQAAIPDVHDNTGTNTSIPSYYVRTPSTAHNSVFESPQSVPSYYIKTPPTTNLPTFPQSTPYIRQSAPPLPIPPTSPQTQRRKRVLTPQNSSRRDQMSPISPMTPSTPRSPWRGDNGSPNAATPRTPRGGWDEEPPPMPTVRDVRNSPRIVVQERF